MKKSIGSSLIEILIALVIIGMVTSSSLNILGNIFMANLKNQERAYIISSAEWWFNRLSHPIDLKQLNDSPRMDDYGKASFDWEVKEFNNGEICITLKVTDYFFKTQITVNRIY